ncbi:dihydroneopterin aldolase [Heyndrickxia coagulans]|mgnify:CR=1 FL=1|jgi:dihydroneopterin aldolase|uniref:7,8-dihydroneopterin aldolase n=2 Tax=Heyndrickxia coagulans TaxID=1398 RepID=A0A150KCH2_HEYCO|nr:dihydroneopterin aldolase [Heyndrickxia coagulans]AEH52122.1 dihydroneopterin aldolase [Heyndrickxia coagulans 2-6]KYC67307.1 Dihydroneopterin aldolase [Heyndrickxia coagulans]MBF8417156.1 dihydroneopterin aldolase [Heyndrickxia coagulans]MDL5041498.1 dihydroneopterin aldolase [Heyndrickxia coagulans]MDT9754672.1 dihydroneopterin aldolase [Heyndrickxia coagulans]
MDKIYIHDMEFYGYHGVLPEENKLGQRFRVSIVLGLDLKRAGETDRLEETVSYADVYACVKKIVEGQPFKLLEAVAEKLAASILALYEKVAEVTVKVTKPDPPIPGHYKSVAVEITRRRKNG